MKDLQVILEHLTSAGTGDTCVLATLLAVEGSSYRRPGARLLRIADGRHIGSISGGCLEEDVLIHAAGVAADGRPRLVTYDTTSENDLIWGAGQGCRGVVTVLIERLPPRPAWAVVLADNLGAGRSTEIAVVWEAENPAVLGTRLAPTEPGPERGQVSDFSPASPGKSRDLTPSDFPARVFRQVIEPPPALFIYGAGDDAQPLARFAVQLGWKVTVADPRSALVAAGRFPEADARVTGTAEVLVAETAPGPRSLAVVMTHSFSHDLGLLRSLLPLPLAYLGLLGPRQRAERLLESLAAEGAPVTRDMNARLHAPVGLDLGSETPDEVALSIIAEMQAVLAGRCARPLREREGRIHG
jgi:xanthine/CO dehydrogenase XdhC/CoxF family maturation factor